MISLGYYLLIGRIIIMVRCVLFCNFVFLCGKDDYIGTLAVRLLLVYYNLQLAILVLYVV